MSTIWRLWLTSAAFSKYANAYIQWVLLDIIPSVHALYTCMIISRIFPNCIYMYVWYKNCACTYTCMFNLARIDVCKCPHMLTLTTSAKVVSVFSLQVEMLEEIVSQKGTCTYTCIYMYVYNIDVSSTIYVHAKCAMCFFTCTFMCTSSCTPK